MKYITVTRCPRHLDVRAKVSADLFIQLCPDLTLLCARRDTFWRLTLGSHGLSGLLIWWPLALEAETLIKTLAGDFSI